MSVRSFSHKRQLIDPRKTIVEHHCICLHTKKWNLQCDRLEWKLRQWQFPNKKIQQFVYESAPRISYCSLKEPNRCALNCLKLNHFSKKRAITPKYNIRDVNGSMQNMQEARQRVIIAQKNPYCKHSIYLGGHRKKVGKEHDVAIALTLTLSLWWTCSNKKNMPLSPSAENQATALNGDTDS